MSIFCVKNSTFTHIIKCFFQSTFLLCSNNPSELMSQILQ